MMQAIPSLTYRVLAVLAFLLLQTIPAHSEERILDFHSAIEIHRDGSMTVTETIRVKAEGKQIRRGIYRDFPTIYNRFGRDSNISDVIHLSYQWAKSALGLKRTIPFHVIDVERDGKLESWHTEKMANGTRVYVGKRNVLLDAGIYTYRLRYRTDNQLGLFETHDELYWNVTGNGWSFAIDQASATVRLPADIPLESATMEAYTGSTGDKGRNYTATINNEGLPYYRTTTTLGPKQGFTLVLTWPKGHITAPTESDTTRILKDNPGFQVAVIGLMIVLAYQILTWWRFGRDPDKGVIIPHIIPPHNLSPAAMRYLSEMGFDDKTFAVALINMAVKGVIRIEESGSSYRIHKASADNLAGLTRGERKIYDKLLGSSDNILLTNSQHSVIGSAKKDLKSYLEKEYLKANFFNNRSFLAVSALLSIVTLVWSALVLGEAGFAAIFLFVWLTPWTIACIWLWRTAPVFAASIFTFFEIMALGMLWALTAGWLLVALLALISCNVIYAELIRMRTNRGRQIMDAIEGFKMYMKTAEQDRLNLIHSPAKTPELFEKYLPYAMALSVDQQWSEQFSDVLAAAGATGTTTYHPTWYQGRHWNSNNIGDFSSTLGSSMASTISSASTAPGSSSGSSSFGGGGSSGGGGGGGGGGGW